MSAKETPRLTAEERRDQILNAASVVFGERGYVGGTTDAIAKQAGVSQAYVVRMFGGKENLFRETAERAAARVVATFRSVIADFTGNEDFHDKDMALAKAYAQLVADRGLLLTMLHLFSLGHDATFGPIARECFLRAYRVIRDEAGMTAHEASTFFAHGMLCTVLLAMRMPDEATNPDAMELMTCSFGDTVTDLIHLAHQHAPLNSERSR